MTNCANSKSVSASSDSLHELNEGGASVPPSSRPALGVAAFHFGVRVGAVEEHRLIIDDIRDASQNDPEPRGRIEVLGVFPHDAPDAIATNMDQAFIRTNMISSGPLRLGHVIEVQWHLQKEQPN